MYLTFLGFFCLSIVSFGRAGSLRGGRSLARKQFEKNNDDEIMEALFSVMDDQIEKDDQITFIEFKQAWLQWDTNKDQILSPDEVDATLEKLNVSYSKTAHAMLAYLELTDVDEWFSLVDIDYDGAIIRLEYVDAYLTLMDGLDDLSDDGVITMSEYFNAYNTIEMYD